MWIILDFSSVQVFGLVFLCGVVFFGVGLFFFFLLPHIQSLSCAIFV